MKDKGKSSVKKKGRRLKAAPHGDLPEFGTRMLDARRRQQNSVRKMPNNGGITNRTNCEGRTLQIRFPQWTSSKMFSKVARDHITAQYIADLVFYFTGRRPFHFPKRNFQFPALCLSNGEVLNTREACKAYVAKIAKSPTHIKERKEYKELVVKMAGEMENGPEVVQLRNEASSEDDAGNPILEVHPAAAAAATGDDEEESSTPMEVDSLSEAVVQLVKPALYVDPSSVIDFASSSCGMDEDFATTYIPSFSMDDYLHSDCQSLGALHRRVDENSGPIRSNLKFLVDNLDKVELEIHESTERSDWEQFLPPPPPPLRVSYPYVAKIAKSPTYIKERKEFKELLVKMAGEMENSPEVVQLRNEASSEDGAGKPILEVDPAAAAATGDDEEENSTPMEEDSVSEAAVQLVKPALYVDPSSVIDFASSSYGMDVDFATTYIPSFSMEDNLHSDCQSLGALHRRVGENSGPIPSNLKLLLHNLDKVELEIYESTEPSDWEQFLPPPSPPLRVSHASYHL